MKSIMGYLIECDFGEDSRIKKVIGDCGVHANWVNILVCVVAYGGGDIVARYGSATEPWRVIGSSGDTVFEETPGNFCGISHLSCSILKAIDFGRNL